MDFKRKFKCTWRIEKQDFTLCWEKINEFFPKSKEICEGSSVGFGASISLALRKLQNLLVLSYEWVTFWSGMNVSVKTWSELWGLQLVGKLIVYWWDGRKFSPKECNETVFSLPRFYPLLLPKLYFRPREGVNSVVHNEHKLCLDEKYVL